MIYTRAEEVVDGYALTRHDHGEIEVFTHEQIHQFHLEDNMVVDSEYFRFRHNLLGRRSLCRRHQRGRSASDQRAGVLRKLLVVGEIERRVAAGEKILTEAALQPISTRCLSRAAYSVRNSKPSQSRAFCRLRRLARASNADLAVWARRWTSSSWRPPLGRP